GGAAVRGTARRGDHRQSRYRGSTPFPERLLPDADPRAHADGHGDASTGELTVFEVQPRGREGRSPSEDTVFERGRIVPCSYLRFRPTRFPIALLAFSLMLSFA